MRVAHTETTIQHYIDHYEMARFLTDDLLRHLQIFHFPAYSNIYIEGNDQLYLYFLVKGQVQCSHYHLNGKLAVFAVSKPFCAIGDFEILSDEPLKSNVTSTQDTVMLGIASDIVKRYGANDPRFLHFLIDQLRDKLYNTNALQMNQVLSVINRLAVYLLAQEDEGIVILPDKETLASMLGTTNRHLNRVLKELVESESISSGYPRVLILNRKALCNLTQ